LLLASPSLALGWPALLEAQSTELLLTLALLSSAPDALLPNAMPLSSEVASLTPELILPSLDPTLVPSDPDPFPLLLLAFLLLEPTAFTMPLLLLLCCEYLKYGSGLLGLNAGLPGGDTKPSELTGRQMGESSSAMPSYAREEKDMK
jgi:hypothetical protein